MKNNKQLLFILTLMALVALPRISVDIYLPSLPHMVGALKTNISVLQLTLSIYMVGYAISMLISGAFSDRFGRKPVLLFGTTVYIGSTIVCALTQDVWILIVARFFQALGGSCGTVVARTIVKDTFEKKEQVKILTYLSTVMAISPAIAPIIGGYLELAFGWHACFLVLTIVGLIVLFLVLVILKETNKELNSKALNYQSLLSSYKLLFSHRAFMAYSLAISFAWCAYFAFIISSSFIFQNLMGLNPIEYGIIFAVVVIGYITGSTMARRLVHKYEIESMIYFAAVLCVFASLIMLVATLILPDSTLAIIMPMMVLMVGVGIIIPTTQVAVMQPFPKIVGTASGLFFFIQMIAGAICGMIIGALHQHTQFPMVIVIVVSTFLLFVSFYAMVWHKKSSLNNITT